MIEADFDLRTVGLSGPFLAHIPYLLHVRKNVCDLKEFREGRDDIHLAAFTEG